MALMDIAILLFLILGLAYTNVSVLVWTVTLTIVLLLFSFFGHLSLIILSLLWVMFLPVAAFALLRKQRIQYVIKPAVQKLRKTMPAISNTEKEAIDAGDVWWEQDLFCGRPDWKKLLNMPAPKLSAEEQSFVDNQVTTLCDMLDDWQVLNNHDLPKEAWDYLRKERFFSIVMPKEYGGRGFSAYASSTIVIKIATHCGSAAVTTMVPNSLGPAELILHYGTPEQKAHYLPRLGSCEEIPCFALTGAESGSDAGAMRDVGIVCKEVIDGKEVTGIRLNWDKRYITLAPVATLLGLAFYMYDPENLLGKGTDIGITLCLIPTTQAGVEIGTRHLPMNLAFMNGPTRGTNVFVPIDSIIGGAAMAGQGWRMLMECLSIGRGISLPALSTASGIRLYRMTGAYASIRKQFNTSLAHFEGIEEGLASIAGLTYIIEACRTMSAGAVDQKVRPSIASAITKYHTTEMSRTLTDHAMDIHAGHAVQLGPRNVISAAHFATPVSITVEGANILTRNLIIFGQGAIRCHPYVLREVELFAEPDTAENVSKLDKLLMSHIGYFISNFTRTLCMGLTGGLFIFSPVKGPLAPYYRQLTRMSAALALLSDASMMLLGGSLKRRENISARLGDILSHLFLASTVLKYHNDLGKPDSDLDYVKWSLETSLFNIQKACDDLLDNFPQTIIGKILHWVVFPWGPVYRKPKDALGKKLVASMIEPSELRERLTKNCYIRQDDNNAIKRIETAFALRVKVEPISKKFQMAVRSGKVARHGSFDERTLAAFQAKILTKSEMTALREYEALEQEIIKVNEYSFDLSTILT
ncbi:MAG: acyl-CoA dehydrogenase [Gammaproteobacteria bacterium]|nr:acyl-CoA dehydrogenase [Gammaproteobacteria bacterium]